MTYNDNNYNAKLSLNNEMMGSFAYAQNTLKDAKETKQLASGEIDGAIIHEIGHLKTLDVLKKNNISPVHFDRYCEEIVDSAISKLGITWGEAFNSPSHKYISKYGASNPSEMIAEAWSNPNYSSLTKAVASELKQGISMAEFSKITGMDVEELKFKNMVVKNANGGEPKWKDGCSGIPANPVDFYIAAVGSGDEKEIEYACELINDYIGIKKQAKNRLSESIANIDKSIQLLENKLAKRGYNPYRDTGTGRFASGPSAAKKMASVGIGEGTQKKKLKVSYYGEETTQEKIDKQLEESQINDVMAKLDACTDYDELNRNILSENGWAKTEAPFMGVTAIRDNPSGFREKKEVMNNGKEFLEAGTYKAEPHDEDGIGLYTTDDKKAAMDYADNNESNIAHLVLDIHNYVDDSKIEKIRKQIIDKSGADSKIGGLMQNKYFVPNTTLASLMGYSGVIRDTESGKEFIAIDLGTVAWNRKLN